MELSRERAELANMGASDSELPAEDRPHAVDSMRDKSGAWQADHYSIWHAQAVKAGRASLLSGASGNSCQGSPVARTRPKSQPYAARFTQTPDFRHGMVRVPGLIRVQFHAYGGVTHACSHVLMTFGFCIPFMFCQSIR